MVNLNKEQLNQLFNLGGQEPPQNPESEHISKILIEIEKRINPECACPRNRPTANANILLVDDLELSVFQLGKLLASCGYSSCVARSVEEAIDQYKKHDFQYVIVDLFLPNPEDGLNLIDTVKSFEKTKTNDTKIIVISGSDDKRLINECFVKGANEFISKLPDWHKRILQHIATLEGQKYGTITEVFTVVEDMDKKIASITLSNLYKNEVLETFKREIQILVNTGYINIIVDLEKVKTLDLNGLNAIVYAYKTCTDKKGSLKLCGVSNSINDSLSYVFLNNLILTFKDKDAALFDYKKEDSFKNTEK